MYYLGELYNRYDHLPDNLIQTSQSTLVNRLVNLLAGMVIGTIVCMCLYRKQGECPRFAPTIKLIGFIKGKHYIGGVRVHHWVYGILLLATAIILNNYVLGGFAISIILHGLSYGDCFDFEN